jgi:hypothetical protein
MRGSEDAMLWAAKEQTTPKCPDKFESHVLKLTVSLLISKVAYDAIEKKSKER